MTGIEAAVLARFDAGAGDTDASSGAVDSQAAEPPYMYELSKRAGNRTAQALARRDAAPRCFASNERLDEHSLAAVNLRVPEIIEAIVNQPTLRILREGREGDLISATAEAVYTRSFDGIRVTMGLGGATSLPGIRIIANAQLVAGLAESLMAFGFKPPPVRIFKADALATRVNGLDPAAAASVTQQTFKFLSDYLMAFHPTVGERVTFLRDDGPGLDDVIGNIIEPLARCVEPLPEVIQRAQGRSTPEAAMIYALAHPVQMETLLPPNGNCIKLWESSVNFPSADAVITVGGLAERNFLRVFDVAVPPLERQGWRRVKRIHLVSGAGMTPAYYPVEGEPVIGQSITRSDAFHLTADDKIGADWKMITANAAHLSDILDFINEWRI